MNELKRIRKEKVTDEVLNNVKAGYVGKFVKKKEKPENQRYGDQHESQKYSMPLG